MMDQLKVVWPYVSDLVQTNDHYKFELNVTMCVLNQLTSSLNSKSSQMYWSHEL